jgi:hypothetical protein
MATVLRVRRTPGGRDAYNDPIPSGETRVAITGCAIAPRSEPEPDERGRNGTIVGLTLYAPLGADLVSTDLIQVDLNDPKDLHEIEDEVGQWSHPDDPAHGGLVAALKRARG